MRRRWGRGKVQPTERLLDLSDIGPNSRVTFRDNTYVVTYITRTYDGQLTLGFLERAVWDSRYRIDGAS